MPLPFIVVAVVVGLVGFVDAPSPSPRSSNHSDCGLVFGFGTGGAGVDAFVNSDVEGNVLVVARGENGSRPRLGVGMDVDVDAPVDVAERAKAENELSNPVSVVDALNVPAPLPALAPAPAPVDCVCSGRVRVGCHSPVEPVETVDTPVYVGARERLPELLIPVTEGTKLVGLAERVGNAEGGGGGPGGGAYVCHANYTSESKTNDSELTHRRLQVYFFRWHCRRHILAKW
jgi:hypothetical protein